VRLSMRGMLSVTLSVAALAVSVALIFTLWRVVGVLPHNNEPAKPVDYSEALEDVTARLDKLTLAVSDGIERVHRAESRIAKTVTSARKLVRESGLEHAGIEAEAAQLPELHGNGIEPLSAVPEQVAPARTLRVPGGVIEW